MICVNLLPCDHRSLFAHPKSQSFCNGTCKITYQSAFRATINESLVELDYIVTSTICSKEKNSSFCLAFQEGLKDFVSDKNDSLLVQMNLDLGDGVDILGPEGVEWLGNMRDNLARVAANSNFTYYLAGGATADQDMQAQVYKMFPTAMAVTAACVFLLIGISFRSLIVPLRSIATIGITVAIVYGCAVFVYQNGALNFLGFYGLRGAGSLVWIPPVLCFSIV